MTTKVTPLRIGTWNVRTFIDSAGSDRPQLRMVLVGRELGRYGIQTAFLSETRFYHRGWGDQISWCWIHLLLERTRKCRDVKQELALPLKRSLLVSFRIAKCINDRLMTLRLPLSGNKHANVKVGNDQEKMQPERDSHSKNRGGKN